jgi:hypothetical protein
MNKFTALSFAAALAVSFVSLGPVAVAAEAAPASAKVVGEKVDSGLGDLPHYSKWADAANKVSGEKVDSGLGDLPHYSKWSDPTGKNPTLARSDINPAQRQSIQVSQAK